MPSLSVSLVLCTCPNDDTAETLAKQVIEQRLAACVNRVPNIASVYRWAGKIETAQETLLLIKTTPALFHKLEKFLISRHPYEFPEIIQLNADSVNKAYAAWVADSIKHA